MGTERTRFFFHLMFRDPQSLRRQVDHLASFWDGGRLAMQIVLAVRAGDDRMKEHLIRYLDLPQVMAPMALLPSGPLAALFAQALGRRPKAIGGRRQTAIITVFGQLPFQRFDALLLRADQP